MGPVVFKLWITLLAVSLASIALAQDIGASLPSAGEIAFISVSDNSEALFTRDVARGISENLVARIFTGNSPPAWSPDGKQLASSYASVGGGQRIYILDRSRLPPLTPGRQRDSGSSAPTARISARSPTAQDTISIPIRLGRRMASRSPLSPIARTAATFS
jgi:hypothetical protein